jgi:hypothetical protein
MRRGGKHHLQHRDEGNVTYIQPKGTNQNNLNLPRPRKINQDLLPFLYNLLFL